MQQHSTRDLATVVAVLTRDRQLCEQLPVTLAKLDAGVETQIVDNLDKLLAHLGRMRADTVVLDASACAETSLSEVLRQGTLKGIPVVVVDENADEEHRQSLLHRGAADHVQRTGPWNSFVARVGQAALVAGRIAKLGCEVEETERHYREILDALTDGVFVLVGGAFRYVNERFATLVGRRPTALIGRVAFVDCVPECDRAALAAQLARLEVSSGERVVLETELQRADGGSVLLELSCHASLVHGYRGVVGIARDVTEDRKRQAELERARQRAAQVERLRALGELAAGVAHDFNNALGTILGRVAMAVDKSQRGDPVGVELQVISKAAQHAAATVHRIRDFSRPSGTEGWQDVDLHTVVADAVTLIRTSVPPSVTLDLQMQATPAVRGNREQLLDVTLNLLRNALDAVALGGTIRVQCGHDDGAAVVQVEDDGDGLGPEIRERIFEPFFTTKGDRGSGLGLSSSQWILRHHDAHIACTSKPGAGTRFRLTFTPFRPSARDTPTLAKAQLDIVVAEDDPSVAEMIYDLLREQGHRATVVCSAAAAEEALDRVDADVLLTDLSLPDMSGWQLARVARKRRPGTLVGLMTGWPIGASEEEIKSRGIDLVLSKPFSLVALSEALDRARGNGN